MKVMTLFGTRPEIIRLCQVIKQLDHFCEQILVHTGQNYDPNLSDIFFKELGLRQPDIHMGIKANDFASQAGQIIAQTGQILAEAKPDRLLILGDTNSGLAAIVAARMGIPVFHMEAGNRCYDNRVPEEINCRIIDHSSNILMPYTQRSKDNLVREGIERQRIFVTGNPIFEVLETFKPEIEASDVTQRLNVEPNKFFLVTAHRAENVDNVDRLTNLVESLDIISDQYHLPLIVSLHPRTADKLQKYGVTPRSKDIQMLTPLGFFDFVSLEKNACCVISDSGTVQEECCIFGVPNITIRDVTERAETIECGSNMLTGVAPDAVLRAIKVVMEAGNDWMPPVEYMERNVARAVTKIVLGYTH